MRLATCRSNFSPSFYAPCKSGSSSVWAAPRRSGVNVRVVAATNQDLGQLRKQEAVLCRLVLSGQLNADFTVLTSIVRARSGHPAADRVLRSHPLCA